MTEPLIGPSPGGIYPRCVWCGGENYGPAVIAYSNGEVPCASTQSCGKVLPPEYVTLELCCQCLCDHQHSAGVLPLPVGVPRNECVACRYCSCMEHE